MEEQKSKKKRKKQRQSIMQKYWRQKKIAETQIDVNGMRLDVEQRGVIVPNRMAVYVNPENHGLLDDIRSMTGVSSVKSVFNGKLRKTKDQQRDPANW